MVCRPTTVASRPLPSAWQPYLAKCGWEVTVYCQEDEAGLLSESQWEGVRRVHIGVGPDTAVNSMRFDWACIRHAVAEKAPLVLTLGYNTALFRPAPAPGRHLSCDQHGRH